MSDDNVNVNGRDKSDYEINVEDYITPSTSEDMKKELNQMKTEQDTVNTPNPIQEQPAQQPPKKRTISPQFVAVETTNKKGKTHTEYVTVSNNVVDEEGNVVVTDKSVDAKTVKAKKAHRRSGAVTFTLAIVFMALAIGFFFLTYGLSGSIAGSFNDMLNSPAAILLIFPILIFFLIMLVTVLPIYGFGITSAVLFGAAWHGDSKAIRVLSIILFIVDLILMAGSVILLAYRFFG